MNINERRKALKPPKTYSGLTLSTQPIKDIDKGIEVNLDGYIDTYNSSFFQKYAMSLIEEGNLHFIFNCTSLNYLSSTGIGLFTVLINVLRPKDGSVVLVNLQPKVNDIFKILGLLSFFTVFDSVEEAKLFLDATIEKKI